MFGCAENDENINNNEQDNNNQDWFFEEIINEPRQIMRVFYVSPRNGLNLRSNPSTSASIIKTLPQFERVNALERAETRDIIDGISGHWYEVDTGDAIGWVFGGYLLSDLSHRSTVILERPIFSVVENSFIFSDERRMHLLVGVGHSGLYNVDSIKVYERTSKDSNYIELSNTRVMFYRLDETDDWLYLAEIYPSGDEDRIHGFVYLFDINTLRLIRDYQPSMRENEIINYYGNINIFGPLLIIHHNYNVFRFESFSEREFEVPLNRIIIEYYQEHDEALIHHMYMEPIDTVESLFNFNRGTFIAEDIGMFPSFSSSRNYIISVHERSYMPDDDYFYNSQYVPSLRIFALSNGYYGKIFEQQVNFRNSDIRSIEWENDREVRINYNENMVMRIMLNNDSIDIFEN